MDSHDPHGETVLAPNATGATGATEPPRRPSGAPRQLGRFRVDQPLGRGGMGAVYAGFDPELERTVAIKILHDAGSPDARARLLREARAAARLAHPNVVTVFETGTADDHDYIAMELVDGETLDAWRARARPGWREVVAAFVAAGRGLAAAHAAGLVHRDFKPGNVLRSRTGRIVVTDFGLAVPAGDTGEVADTTLDAPVSELFRTQTGLVLGTPAYMAPEQWTAESVGAASDQFAFCIALWEALAGVRPFRATTREELRSQVLSGAADLDASCVPRGLRAIVRRGLAADPARRWPSMAALIGALERRLARRRRIVLGVGAGAFATLGIAGAIVLGPSRHTTVTEACRGALDPAIVWSPQRAAPLAAKHRDAARLIATDIASWRDVRARVCGSQDAVRTAQLACLDAVMARIDVLAKDLETATASGSEGTGALLIEPVLCTSSHPPQLVATIEPALATALAGLRRAMDGQRVDGPRTTEPCANLAATLAQLTGFDSPNHDPSPARLQEVFDAMRGLERDYTRCADDALRGLAAMALIGEPVPGVLERAEEAVRAFPSERLRGRVALLRGSYASMAGELDEADQLFATALQHFVRRNLPTEQLEVILDQAHLFVTRGTPADLRAAIALADRWRGQARALGDSSTTMSLERWAGHARWRLGDVAGADALLQTAGAEGGMSRSLGNRPARDLAGIVVDEAGAPVAGAQIAAGTSLIADSAMVASPLYGDATIVTSDAAGRFTLSDAIGDATAVHDGRRGTGTTRIVLHPTTTVAGRVTLADPAIGRIHVLVRRGDFTGVAPVLEDGSYTLANVPRGTLEVEVLPISVTTTIAPTRVVASGDRTIANLVERRFQQLYVIARTPDTRAPEFAPVWILLKADPALRRTTFGKFHRHTQDVVPTTASIRARPPTAIATQVHADDLIAELADRPHGPITICASAFNREHVYAMATRPELVEELAVACTTIDATATVAVVELPPLRRAD